MAEPDPRPFASPFAIFRAKDAADYAEDGVMYIDQAEPMDSDAAGQLYGEGFRYTAIYSANREQIRDPNKIYPGQTLTMPPQR